MSGRKGWRCEWIRCPQREAEGDSGGCGRKYNSEEPVVAREEEGSPVSGSCCQPLGQGDASTRLMPSAGQLLPATS